jgi:hypothetical protein
LCPSGFTEDDHRGQHSATGDREQAESQFAHLVTQLTLERVDLLDQLSTPGGHLTSDARGQTVEPGRPGGEIVDDAVAAQADADFRIPLARCSSRFSRSNRAIRSGADLRTLDPGDPLDHPGVMVSSKAGTRLMGLQPGHLGGVSPAT